MQNPITPIGIQKSVQNFIQKIRWLALSVTVGLMAGFSTAIFLLSLQAITALRVEHPRLIWLLPFIGLLIGFIYSRYAGRAESGSSLILEEIHDPKKVLPLRMAPLVFFGTLFTHLGGGSAGREGTAVQMGATLADQLSRCFKIESEERKILLVAGLGAGFSAAIGTPWAGALFGLEILYVGRLRIFAVAECLVSSFVAYYVCGWMGASHFHFPEVMMSWDFKTALGLVAAGLLFGAVVRFFIWLTYFIAALQKRYVQNKIWQPFIGGLLLVFLFEIFQAQRYAGLGLEVIQESFHLSASWIDPATKTFLTALTLGSGFKGGEFIPLVFIGTTLGSFLAGICGLSLTLMAAVGFSAVFGAASNAPLACALMAGELFGWTIFPMALIVGWIAYRISGDKGIYGGQKVIRSKSASLSLLMEKIKPKKD
jgi:H+/Cl- antiporter ClcA